MDHIIQNMPRENDKYYIQHKKKGSNTFTIKEDPHQKDKDRVFK